MAESLELTGFGSVVKTSNKGKKDGATFTRKAACLTPLH